MPTWTVNNNANGIVTIDYTVTDTPTDRVITLNALKVAKGSGTLSCYIGEITSDGSQVIAVDRYFSAASTVSLGNSYNFYRRYSDGSYSDYTVQYGVSGYTTTAAGPSGTSSALTNPTLSVTIPKATLESVEIGEVNVARVDNVHDRNATDEGLVAFVYPRVRFTAGVGTKLTYTVSGLPNGSSATWEIQARDSSGVSADGATCSLNWSRDTSGEWFPRPDYYDDVYDFWVDNLAADREYELTLTLTGTNLLDPSNTKTATKKVKIPSAFYTIDFLGGGHGVAFGGPAKEEGFWEYMPSHFEDDVRIDGHRLLLQDATANSVAYGGTGAKIQFSNAAGDQNGQLIFTDYDVVDPGASLTWVTDQPNGSWLRSQYIRATEDMHVKRIVGAQQTGTSWVDGAKGSQAFLRLPHGDGNYMQAFASIGVPGGGAWVIAGYDAAGNLHFNYNTKANMASGTNSPAKDFVFKTNGGTTAFLREDGTWAAPPNTNTTYSAGSNITLTGTTFSLTKANVTGALGYTPPTTNSTYSMSTTTSSTNSSNVSTTANKGYTSGNLPAQTASGYYYSGVYRVTSNHNQVNVMGAFNATPSAPAVTGWAHATNSDNKWTVYNCWVKI